MSYCNLLPNFIYECMNYIYNLDNNNEDNDDIAGIIIKRR